MFFYVINYLKSRPTYFFLPQKVYMYFTHFRGVFSCLPNPKWPNDHYFFFRIFQFTNWVYMIKKCPVCKNYFIKHIFEQMDPSFIIWIKPSSSNRLNALYMYMYFHHFWKIFTDNGSSISEISSLKFSYLKFTRLSLSLVPKCTIIR